MKTQKLHPGSEFPALNVYDQDDKQVDISKPTGKADWQMIVVYRGSHCPKCTEFLNNLASYRQQLLDVNIGLSAVSTDSKKQMDEHLTRLDINFPLFYGLTLEQSQSLGLYISKPAPWGDSEHEFSEPGLFVINSDGVLQIVDISNSPFSRPDPDTLVRGLVWMRDPKINYPIRGTHA